MLYNLPSRLITPVKKTSKPIPPS